MKALGLLYTYEYTNIVSEIRAGLLEDIRFFRGSTAMYRFVRCVHRGLFPLWQSSVAWMFNTQSLLLRMQRQRYLVSVCPNSNKASFALAVPHFPRPTCRSEVAVAEPDCGPRSSKRRRRLSGPRQRPRDVLFLCLLA